MNPTDTRDFLRAMTRYIARCQEEMDFLKAEGITEDREEVAALIVAAEAILAIYHEEEAGARQRTAARIRTELGQEAFAKALETGDYSAL